MADYKLNWGKGSVSPFHADNLGWQMLIELVYIVFLFFGVVATKVMEFVTDPWWLDSLVEGYEKISKQAFTFVNPILLGAFAFTVLMVYVLFDKVKSASMGMERADVERVGAGLVLLSIIVILALNPFYLMRFALSLVGSAVDSLAGTDVSSGTSAKSVDALLRSPTLAINYAGERVHADSPGCRDEDWSRKADGFTGTACIQPEADYGTSMHLIIAVIACAMAASALFFALAAWYKFVKHLSFSIIGLVLLPWVAAVSMMKRRSFDLLGRTFAVSAGNLLMAICVQMFTILGPVMAGLFLTPFAKGASSSGIVFSMLIIWISYFALFLLLLYVTRKNSALVRALRADATTALNTYMAAPGAPGAFFGMVNNRTTNNSMMKQLRQQLRKLRRNSFEEDDMASDRRDHSDITPVQKVINYTRLRNAPVKVLDMGTKMLPAATSSYSRSVTYNRDGSSSLQDAADRMGFAARRMQDSSSGIQSASENLRSTAYWSQLAEVERQRKNGVEVNFNPTTVVSATVNPVVALPGGGTLDTSKDSGTDHEAVRAKILNTNMNSPYPAFGGRSSRAEIERIVEDTVQQVESRRAQVIQNTNAREGVIDAEVISVVDTPARNVTNDLKAYRGARAMRERSSMRTMDDLAGSSSTDQVQSTIRAARGKSSRMDTYPSYGKQRGMKFPSAYKGAACTRGDTARTVSQQILRSGEAEAVTEAAVNRLKARGESVIIRIPSEVSSIILTSDNYDLPSADPGMGFGDRVF